MFPGGLPNLPSPDLDRAIAEAAAGLGRPSEDRGELNAIRTDPIEEIVIRGKPRSHRALSFESFEPTGILGLEADPFGFGRLEQFSDRFDPGHFGDAVRRSLDEDLM